MARDNIPRGVFRRGPDGVSHLVAAELGIADDGMPTGELPGMAARDRRLAREQRAADVADDLPRSELPCDHSEHPDVDERGYCLLCGSYTDPYGIR